MAQKQPKCLQNKDTPNKTTVGVTKQGYTQQDHSWRHHTDWPRIEQNVNKIGEENSEKDKWFHFHSATLPPSQKMRRFARIFLCHSFRFPISEALPISAF